MEGGVHGSVPESGEFAEREGVQAAVANGFRNDDGEGVARAFFVGGHEVEEFAERERRGGGEVGLAEGMVDGVAAVGGGEAMTDAGVGDEGEADGDGVAV